MSKLTWPDNPELLVKATPPPTTLTEHLGA
jgi:hypothetical protein